MLMAFSSKSSKLVCSTRAGDLCRNIASNVNTADEEELCGAGMRVDRAKEGHTFINVTYNILVDLTHMRLSGHRGEELERYYPQNGVHIITKYMVLRTRGSFSSTTLKPIPERLLSAMFDEDKLIHRTVHISIHSAHTPFTENSLPNALGYLSCT